MGGSGGYPLLPTMEVLVRCHSALIVRQALARGQFGDKAAASPKAPAESAKLRVKGLEDMKTSDVRIEVDAPALRGAEFPSM